MTMQSGLVAVLDDTRTRIAEIRDLGPDPVPCQDGAVLPFLEIAPTLAENQRVTGAVDTISSDQVVRTWIVEPIPPASRWADVRADRNARLAASDWTQLADVPLDADGRTAWAVYRQALRDITTQPDPWAIDWPSLPT